MTTTCIRLYLVDGVVITFVMFLGGNIEKCGCGMFIWLIDVTFNIFIQITFVTGP